MQENKTVGLQSLLESGVHFGHQTRKWDPRMEKYIFTVKDDIHILDLYKSAELLDEAKSFVERIAANGGKLLFVGTKRQAQQSVIDAANATKGYFIDYRWLGGTFTNFTTIQKRIEYLINTEEKRAKNQLNHLPKKELQKVDDKLAKLNKYLGGVKEMMKLPEAIFVVDIGKENIAIQEARKLKIPIIGIVDTDCNPELVDYPIPGNDDSIKSVRFLINEIVDSYTNGANSFQTEFVEQLTAAEEATASTEETTAEEPTAEIEEATASTEEITTEEPTAEIEEATASTEEITTEEPTAKIEEDTISAEETTTEEPNTEKPEE
ncbi:MAG: 30S ribosomal protein S2 [Chloroflexi bacterium]|nr:30S ribosomal protein S2 [Chloroflexota bacterium]